MTNETPQYPAVVYVESAAWGVFSLVLAIAVAVLSVATSIVMGVLYAQSAEASGSVITWGADLASDSPAEQFVSLGTTLHPLIGTLVGGIALGLGILSAITQRGRKYAIVAIVIALAAPIVSLVVYFVALTVATPFALNGQ